MLQLDKSNKQTNKAVRLKKYENKQSKGRQGSQPGDTVWTESWRVTANQINPNEEYAVLS